MLKLSQLGFEAYVNDTLLSQKLLESSSIDLTISSPPYNIGKEYEDCVPLDKYLSYHDQVVEQLARVTSNTGSVCWQVGNHIDKGEVFPLDFYLVPLFLNHGFQYRARFVWHFGHGLHCKKRFSGRHETILWFTKTDNYTCNINDKLPPHAAKGGGDQLRLFPKNSLEVDLQSWDKVKKEWESGIWEIPNVKHNHPEKVNHPCQFPIELAERCILALTKPGNKVLDCFSGSGQVLLAALMYDLECVIIDRDENYISQSMERVDQFRQGRLKFRPICRNLLKS